MVQLGQTNKLMLAGMAACACGALLNAYRTTSTYDLLESADQNIMVLDDDSAIAIAIDIDLANPKTADGVHFTNRGSQATAIEVTVRTNPPQEAAIEHEAFTKCMLQIEEYYQEFFPQYANSQQPFPISVKMVDDQFYVLMSLTVTNDFDKWRHPTTTYACNGVTGGIVSRAGKKVAGTLVVKCHQSLSPSSGALVTSINVVPQGNETAKVEYNLEKFLECEQKDIALFANTSSIMTGSRSIKTGITATFAGGREEALEWAIYHHMIGFDHVWIYVNEPWDDGKGIQSLDFVTFIPYSTKVQDFWDKTTKIQVYNTPPEEVFRVASQNDALWRAKRMGLDWMAFTDVDELVDLGSSPLKTYLADFKAKYGGKYVGLFLRSVPYGKNIENETKPELLIDYTWRQDLNLTKDCCRARNKLIMDVAKASVVSLHYHGFGRLFIPETTDELRVNHYKRKDDGVFNMKYHYLGPPHIIEDTRLRDKYRKGIVEQLTLIRERTT